MYNFICGLIRNIYNDLYVLIWSNSLKYYTEIWVIPFGFMDRKYLFM